LDYAHASKVTQTKACAISKAVWDKFSALLASETKRASATFLSLAARFSRTWHEERFSDSLAKFGLTANIPMSFVDAGLKEPHRILSIKDFVKNLDLNQKLDKFCCKVMHCQHSKISGPNFETFQPQHSIYSTHKGQLECCIPIAVHADESQTLKKRRYHDSAAATTYRQKWHSEKESNPCRARLQLFGKFLRFTILMERYACKGIQP